MVSGAGENRLSSREMPQVGWPPEQKPGLHWLPHWESYFLPQGLCTCHSCYQIHAPSIIFKMKYFTLKENQKFKNIYTRWFCGTLSFIHFLSKSMQIVISRFLPSQISCFEHSDVHRPHFTRPSLQVSADDTSFPHRSESYVSTFLSHRSRLTSKIHFRICVFTGCPSKSRGTMPLLLTCDQ